MLNWLVVNAPGHSILINAENIIHISWAVRSKLGYIHITTDTLTPILPLIFEDIEQSKKEYKELLDALLKFNESRVNSPKR